MPLCKECEQLGETHKPLKGDIDTKGTLLEKGEKCDRCGKTSYEEANEPENHTHDWQPDGDSWKKTVKPCTCNYKKELYQFQHDERCSKEQQRVRRYTCQCGKSKTIKINN